MSRVSVDMPLLDFRPQRWLALLVGVLGAACGLSDLFRPSGLEQVTLTYQSDTILTRGTTTAPTIAVRVAGVDVRNPRLRFTSSDTEIVGVTAGGDSLIARALGVATVIIALLDPTFTDSLPTIRQGLRVRP